jgi:hypothetical protein
MDGDLDGDALDHLLEQFTDFFHLAVVLANRFAQLLLSLVYLFGVFRRLGRRHTEHLRNAVKRIFLAVVQLVSPTSSCSGSLSLARSL